MEHEIDWRPKALKDLEAIYDWVAEQADPVTASAYVARIQAFAVRLRHFPNRGTPRFQVSPGLRSVTFERRIIVSYRVNSRTVRILRLIDTARDFRRAFGGTTG